MSSSTERPDLVVVDTEARRAVAIVEVKYLAGDTGNARFREAAAQIVRYARGFCDESDLPALIRRSLIALSREAPPMIDESAVAPRSVDFAAIVAGEVRNWVRERLLTAP
jgi:hypothetical protein